MARLVGVGGGGGRGGGPLFGGIIPGTFVFALAGSGLGSALEASADFSVAAVLTPDIIAALVGLAGLALVPVLYKKFRGRHGD